MRFRIKKNGPSGKIVPYITVFHTFSQFFDDIDHQKYRHGQTLPRVVKKKLLKYLAQIIVKDRPRDLSIYFMDAQYQGPLVHNSRLLRKQLFPSFLRIKPQQQGNLKWLQFRWGERTGF